MQKTPITHILTGGTIGGCVPEYPEVGRLVGIFNDSSNIDKFLTQSLQTVADFSVVELCKKDSREISDQDRENIAKIISEGFKNRVRHFLITHGTYTMPETGIYLLEHLTEEVLSQCSVVITGSMYPLNFIGSDALLNIGASLSSLLNASSPLGVKVCMHGKNWDPRKIRKDAENLIFQEIE